MNIESVSHGTNVMKMTLKSHDPNQTSDLIISSILRSADECLPKVKFNKHTKPYWSNDLKLAHAESRRLRRVWINLGRPRGSNANLIESTKLPKVKYFIKVYRTYLIVC